MAKKATKTPTNEIPADISSRTHCDILEDMRKAYKTRNFSYLPGLIEELQYRAWRMENAIEKHGGWGGIRDQERRRLDIKEEIRQLEEKRDKLKEETGESTDGRDTD